MKRIFRRRMRLQSRSRTIFTILSLISLSLAGSEATKDSFENLEGIKSGEEVSALGDGNSKILNIGHENNRNSPALNSFLKNVLQAQDELKWIDQAVHRTGTKETQGKVPARYLRSSSHTPASKYHSKIRFKRRSDPQLDDDESWMSKKRRSSSSNDDDSPERVYLDDEMKFKRRANPSAEFDHQEYRSLPRKGRRSNFGDRQPVDDPTLKLWAREDGLEVPEDWLESGERVRKSGITRRSRNEKRDESIESPSGEHDARGPSGIRREVDVPTLESLKKTVLELKKSLEDSDRKMDSVSEKEGLSGLAKNRERHAEDISERKEKAQDGATSTFRNRDASSMTRRSAFDSHYHPGSNSYEENSREEPKLEISSGNKIFVNSGRTSIELSEFSGSNWWEDPRSAVDMFDFKRREDDVEDDADDDEDSEFDYIARRVKRDEDVDGGEKRKVRVYRRAGFGELYPDGETFEEEEDEEEEEDPEAEGGPSKMGVRVYREIREAAGTDKINDERSSDGVESGYRKNEDINVNENGHSVSEDGKAEEIKNLGYDNPAKKSEVLKNGENQPEETRPPGTTFAFLSQDEKRSSSSSSSSSPEEFSADHSAEKRNRSEQKVETNQSIAENLSDEKTNGENTEEKKEVEKSEPTDDDVHKISENSNENAEHRKDKEEQKDTRQDERASENSEEKDNKEGKDTGTESKDEPMKSHSTELASADTVDKITDGINAEDKSEDQDKPKAPEMSDGIEKINADHEHDSKLQGPGHENQDSTDDGEVKLELDQEAKGQASKTVKLVDPGSSSPKIGENTDEKDSKDDERVGKNSESSNKSPDELSRDGQNKEKEKCDEDRKIGVEQDKVKFAKREDSTRKLLWLSEDSQSKSGRSKDVEIRDGRRDSAWDQNRAEKSGQRPANFLKTARAHQRLKNPEDEVNFVQRSLMVAKDNAASPDAVDLEKRSGIRSTKKDSVADRYDETDLEIGDKSKRLEKRSVKFYPENVREDKQNFPQSVGRKRSVEKIVELDKKHPDFSEVAYEIEDDGVSRDAEDSKDSGVDSEGDESEAVESEARFSHQDKDRDPMRDRINMLIKQKLDDRGKGKMSHMKREANYNQVANIEYYDYDSDLNNGGDSDADSTALEDNQQIPEQNNSTYHEVAIDRVPQPEPEPVTKMDENAEEERRKELEREEGKYNAPKQEFISDVELAKTQTNQPFLSETNAGLESQEKSYTRENEDGFKRDQVDNEMNERGENQHAKPNGHWLGQPAEADPGQDEDSIDGQGRYQNPGEPGEKEKASENEGAEFLGEPLEYSVNVHGKLDPESIDAALNEKANSRERDFSDNEKRSDKVQTGIDEEFKSSPRSRGDEKIEDDRLRREKSSPGRGWRYRNSARIEEGTRGHGASRRNYFSRNGNNPDEIVQAGFYPEDQAVGFVEDSGGAPGSVIDSLPTMLDRSGLGNHPAPGERTYLVIAPPQVQCPRKPVNENPPSSSDSNYLALKVTDDMFKGGVEQGNPIEEKIPDGNLMGKTTTEWKVIKMADSAKAKPRSDGPSQSLTENLKSNPNLAHDDDSRNLKSLGVDPQDVVHESIVDPEEMAGDFDDDTRPRFGRDLKCLRESGHRFGRSLQSVSYPIDPFQKDHRIHEEKPADKYLKSTQSSFTKLEAAGDQKGAENLIEIEKQEETPRVKNSTGIVDARDNFGKRSSDLETPLTPDGDNDTRIDKDKRGSTNVEEWEMNAPTVQKQHLLEDLGGKDAADIRTADLAGEKKNNELESTPKTLFPNSDDTQLTSGSHEREIRSVRLRDDNFESDQFPVHHEFRPVDEDGRSKIQRKKKSNSASRRYSYDLEGAKGFGSPRIGFGYDWEKSDPDEHVEDTRRQSKGDEYRRSNQDGGKSAKKDGSSHRHHHHTGTEKHRNKGFRSREFPSHGTRESRHDSADSKALLKSVKGRREKDFQGVERAPVPQHGKAHNKMMASAADHSHNILQSKSFQTAPVGEEYDSGKPETKEEKKVLDENAGDPVTKVKPGLDDPQKKKYTVLLAADNMEDESQMDLALHGELAGKIVERIFDQVQKNDALKTALGPGLYRKHKSEDAIATDKIYRQGLDEDEVKHTEGMMRRVMELLGRLILDEVQRKTCASLPPDMREFLQWMLGVEDEDRATDQVPPLPFIHNQEPNHRQGDKFLFENSVKHYEGIDIDELNKKVRLLRSLIHEYNALTDREKTKVQTVHDYLVRQLGLLLDYIETKEAEESKAPDQEGGGRIGGGNILQYQNAVPNGNGSMFGESTLSPLVNTPSILMLSNASFVEQPRAGASNHFVRSRLRETRSSGKRADGEDEGVEKKHGKRKHGKHQHPDQGRDHRRRKHRRKGKKKKKKKHQKHKDTQSPEYRKLARRAAMLRKKRANIYEDDWDPVDSGYEEPAIYTSNGELTNKRKRSFSKNRADPYFWADVLSGKVDSEEDFGEKLSRNLDRNEKGRVFADRNPEVTNFEKRGYEDFGRSSNFDDGKTGERSVSGSEMKRDVISASIALQPWLNPKPDDLVSPDYLKDLTTQLVHGSLVPPIYPGEKKRDVDIPGEGRNRADDEVTLLTKREAWKAENEQQLEEVAFGKDMRGNRKEKEQFEKLTKMDKKNASENGAKRKKREETKNSSILETRDVDSGSKKSGALIRSQNIDDKIVEEAVKNDNSIRNEAFSEARIAEEINPLEGDSQKNISRNETLDTAILQNIKNLTEKQESKGAIAGSAKGDEKMSGGSRNEKSETEKEKRSEKEDRGSKKSEFLALVQSGGNFDKREIGKSAQESSGNQKAKRSSGVPVSPEVEGSAILPLLEVSEQRQEQKQAAKTEKDDQRDIADQMLGYSSRFILNTY